MATVIFSHGKETGPNGTKIKVLSEVARENGFQTQAVDYRMCKDAEERVVLLKGEMVGIAKEQLILVGSSMGGYVSLAVANSVPVKGLFLMCPALYLPDYEIQNFHPKTNVISIIHGWEDDIVPYSSSVKFGRENQATVHLVSDNHRLSNSHAFLRQLFDQFLKKAL